jgi:chromosomal replication initiator protein
MQAVGHAITSKWKGLRLTYVSSENFTNEVISSLRTDRMVSFRDKLRNVDVLLMDDIEFIAGKERTQEEFFRTFNTLYEAQKQVVITCDCPPKELPGLEERLRSRFAWGLTAELQTPDVETKLAILANKCESQGVALPDNVALLISKEIRSSIRDLEGALTRLIAYSSLTGAPVSESVAREVLKGLTTSEARRGSIGAIQNVVSKHFGLKRTQLLARDNSPHVVVPRRIAMWLARVLTDASLPEIGRAFGGKHHTTVLQSIQQIDRLRAIDKDLNKTLNRLLSALE